MTRDYLGIALLVGIAIFVAGTTIWDHGDPTDRRGRIARTLVVAIVGGLLWPSAVLIALAWLTPVGRRWLNWWLDGPDDGQRYGQWLRQGPPK